MHFQSFVLMTLSAGALAIPSSLSPRKNHDSYPSIAPYNDKDCTQQAGPSHDFIRGSGCVKITWPQDNVGINWGSFVTGMYAFDAFTDDACTDYAWTHINKSGPNDAVGANACFAMSIHGGPWKSVQKYYGPQEE